MAGQADTAGRWIRVSGDSQAEEDQVPDIDVYCDERGYLKGRTFEVHGKSAYKGAQDPDWQRVVKAVKAGEIDVVVCWMVDRLDRKNLLHAIPMALEVLNAGGRIEFSVQPECNLDANSPTIDDEVDLFSRRINDANRESKIKAQRVRKAHDKRRRIGSAIGRAPWGYEIMCETCKQAPVKPRCKDHRKLFVPTALGRKYIPVIFAMAIAGKSLRDIASWLTAEKVPTANGKPWNEGYLGNRMIKNPTYYGARRNAGELETEALISATTYQEANAALKSRIRPGRATSKLPKALLSPTCGECYGKPREGCPSGISPMYRVLATDEREGYYRCAGHGPMRKGCGFMVLVSELDAKVTDAMTGDLQWHVEPVFIAGDDKSDEIAKLRERGANLFRDGDYAGAAECGRQATELESAPRVKPHWDAKVTDQTESDYYASLGQDERREYLASRSIVAGREVLSIGPRWDAAA